MMKRALVPCGLVLVYSTLGWAQGVGTPLTATVLTAPVATPNEVQLEAIRKVIFGDTQAAPHFQEFFFLGHVSNGRAMCVVTANSAFENIGVADSVVLFDILTRKKDKRIRSMDLFDQMGSSQIATRVNRQGNTVVLQSPDPQRFSTATLIFATPQVAIRQLQSISISLNETDTLPSRPNHVKVDKACTGLRFITMLDDGTQAQMAQDALANFNKNNPGSGFIEAETSFCAMNLRGALRCSYNTVPGGDGENPFIRARFQIVNGKPVVESTDLDDETE
jgi:hypothetical protein